MNYSLACVSSASLLAFSLLFGTPSTAIAEEGVPPLPSNEDAGRTTLVYSDDRTDSATTTDNAEDLPIQTDDDIDSNSEEDATDPLSNNPSDSGDPVDPEQTEPEQSINTVTLIDGKPYWVGADGKVLTGKGWHKVNDLWLFSRDDSGTLFTGWLKHRGTWYWLDPETCVMATGWADVDGKRYHLSSSGAMETGWKKLGGTWYHLSNSGAMDTGWKKLGGKWYWLDPETGAMATGWKELDGTWYHLSSSGAMETGWKKLGGTWYHFSNSGAMDTGWKKLGGKWYWLDPESGRLKTGWLLLDDIWYWQGEYGAAQNQIKVINGIGYAFDNSCAWRTVDVSELPKESSMNKKQSSLINACYKVPSPGAGFCSEWVSEVFEYTGQKHLYLDACDMANDYCHNSNLSQLKPGMIIAVRTHSHTVPGSIWGHVCIYIGNGKVIENVGSIRTTDLGSWLWWYGVSVTPKWGWYDNKALA